MNGTDPCGWVMVTCYENHVDDLFLYEDYVNNMEGELNVEALALLEYLDQLAFAVSDDITIPNRDIYLPSLASLQVQLPVRIAGLSLSNCDMLERITMFTGTMLPGCVFDLRCGLRLARIEIGNTYGEFALVGMENLQVLSTLNLVRVKLSQPIDFSRTRHLVQVYDEWPLTWCSTNFCNSCNWPATSQKPT